MARGEHGQVKERARNDGELRVQYPECGGEVAALAASELANGLSAMLGQRVGESQSARLSAREILVVSGPAPKKAGGADRAQAAGSADGFEVWRAGSGRDGLVIGLRGESERALLHAVSDLLERLGARYPVARPPEFPRIERASFAGLKPYRVAPAFSRRAFVSDIMTWHYADPQRLEMHLRHDREFIPWMARRGINRFFYIRHAQDTALKIEELEPLYRQRAIGCEYGGHVLQLLLPRERFQSNPEFFPVGPNGARNARGNLCASNPQALALVVEGALGYVRDNPEIDLLHIWGADVWKDAWCRCAACAGLSPQLQYLRVVNAVAAALEAGRGPNPPVAYLAYHDTLEPDPGLKPLGNVWVEWAPRERCYGCAIDDPRCEANPRYLEALKRYVDLFDGRAHVFEYYADAALFGGLGFATPSVIARDVRAYRALGITSVSCLTFGAYSVLAYPVNLEAFVRATRSPDFEPDNVIAEVATGRHGACAARMAAAYRATARAAALVLNYGDVLRPAMRGRAALAKRAELIEAASAIEHALAAAQAVAGARNEAAGIEALLWSYNLEILRGLGDCLAARESVGTRRAADGERAIGTIATAFERVREIGMTIGDTWGLYDFGHVAESALRWLRGRFEEDGRNREAT